MEDDLRYTRLAAALRDDRGDFIAAWEAGFGASRLRLPGSFEAAVLARMILPFFESFAEALPLASLSPGSSDLREVEKSVAFLGSVTGSSGTSGFDLAAMVLAIRDILTPHLEEVERAEFYSFFEWLVVLALESFGSAGAQAERERQRESLERGTPVILVTPEIPATLLVGNPDNIVLDAVFSRLLMLTVRVGASVVIIDATGLQDAKSPPVLVALQRLFNHQRMARGVELVAIGLDDECEAIWQQLAVSAEINLTFESSFDRAVGLALGHTEFRLVRRPS